MKMDPLTWVMAVSLFLGGAGIGVGVTSAMNSGGDSAATTEAQAIVQLSDMDILKVPCSADYIGDHGDGLCREMFCWAQTNSKIGETSGISCDAISNINNTITILDICGKFEAPVDHVSCMTLFRERK